MKYPMYPEKDLQLTPPVTDTKFRLDYNHISSKAISQIIVHIYYVHPRLAMTIKYYIDIKDCISSINHYTGFLNSTSELVKASFPLLFQKENLIGKPSSEVEALIRAYQLIVGGID